MTDRCTYLIHTHTHPPTQRARWTFEPEKKLQKRSETPRSSSFYDALSQFLYACSSSPADITSSPARRSQLHIWATYRYIYIHGVLHNAIKGREPGTLGPARRGRYYRASRWSSEPSWLQHICRIRFWVLRHPCCTARDRRKGQFCARERRVTTVRAGAANVSFDGVSHGWWYGGVCACVILHKYACARL